MKNTFRILTTVLALTVFVDAQALENARRSVRSTSAPAPTAYTSTESNVKTGFGFATFGSSRFVGGGSLSAMFELSPVMSFQGLFGIMGSDPFSFSVGGIFRKVLVGDTAGGFHFGLGANLGLQPATSATATSTTEFFLNIAPVVGFGFGLGGAASNVRLTFDGGAVFHVTPGFQFSVDSLSQLAGASIHYMF